MTANAVRITVQVVDEQPRVLHLSLPTYLPARELVQRLARDAGIATYTPEGHRAALRLWVRGRVLEPDETLGTLGVISGELVHLLPDVGVVAPRDRALQAPPALRVTSVRQGIGLAVATLGFAAGWTVASIASGPELAWLPGAGLGLLCVATARRWFAERARVHAASAASAGALALVAQLGTVLTADALQAGVTVVVALLGTGIGLGLGFLGMAPSPAECRS